MHLPLIEFVQDYDATDLQEFQKAILSGCDYNKDGKINKKVSAVHFTALNILILNCHCAYPNIFFIETY